MGDVLELVRKRPFRRKRRFQGATWTPQKQSADRRDGVWCPTHRIFHGYSKLGAAYEKDNNGNWVVLWSCPTTYNVLQVMPLKPSKPTQLLDE